MIFMEDIKMTKSELKEIIKECIIEEGFFNNKKYRKINSKSDNKSESNNKSDVEDLKLSIQNWIKSPYTLGDGNDKYILWYFYKKYGADKFKDFVIKNKSKFDKIDIKEYIFGGDISDKDDSDFYNSIISKTSPKCNAILLNDEYLLLIGRNNNIYEIDSSSYSDPIQYDISKESAPYFCSFSDLEE